MNGDKPDLFKLAAEARPLIQQLHQRSDVVVQFKSDSSDFSEDRLNDLDRAETEHPGRFSLDSKFLTLNLDTLISDRRPMPTSLATIEDWRKHPVFAGVMAHAAAHARFSKWDQDPANIPSSLPNPDFNADHPTPEKDFEITEDDGSITVEQHEDPDYGGPESFPVSQKGRLMEVAAMIEEARVERLGMASFGRTWREAMKFSSTHLTLESLDEGDEANDGEGESALDAALRTMILVGGRTVAGTLGFDTKNRTATQKVLGNAQKVIEEALADSIAEGADPFYEAMGLVTQGVNNNDHDDPNVHLEYARRILEIIHPEDKENPDSPGSGAQGGGAGAGAMGLAAGQAPGEKPEDDDDGDGEDDVEGSGSKVSGNQSGEPDSQALQDLKGEMEDALNELAAQVADDVEREEKYVDQELDDDGSDSFGAVRSKNEKPPHIDRFETPTNADRELYRKALTWMQAQVEPTVTEFERGQWMPGGGTKFNARSWARDNLRGMQGSERTDWDKDDQIVKAAPPVKVGIMLDGSGSMASKARESASVAWAVANAAAMMPEARTVSLVFGHHAMLTQEAGHTAPKEVAVARNNAGWENFKDGARMLEEELQIEDAATDEGDPSNVLIIVVSDLMYGGAGQGAVFTAKTREWKERGFRTLVVGARPQVPGQPAQYGAERDAVELVEMKDLFQ